MKCTLKNVLYSGELYVSTNYCKKISRKKCNELNPAAYQRDSVKILEEF
jgi:hypothetical protein